MIPLAILLACIVFLDILRAAYIVHTNQLATIEVLRLRITEDNSIHAFSLANLGHNHAQLTNKIT
jgi:hypothetical protein